MQFKSGDDVIVTFDGNESPGEVITVSAVTGYILCRILSDPEADYGSLNEMFPHMPTVCVREKDLRFPALTDDE